MKGICKADSDNAKTIPELLCYCSMPSILYNYIRCFMYLWLGCWYFSYFCLDVCLYHWGVLGLIKRWLTGDKPCNKLVVVNKIQLDLTSEELVPVTTTWSNLDDDDNYNAERG